MLDKLCVTVSFDVREFLSLNGDVWLVAAAASAQLSLAVQPSTADTAQPSLHLKKSVGVNCAAPPEVHNVHQVFRRVQNPSKTGVSATVEDYTPGGV